MNRTRAFIHRYTYLITFLLVLVLLNSCKFDSGPNEYAENSEDQYFDDYEEPILKWGLIDTSGRFVVAPMFDDILEALNPDYIAANKNGKWGYINSQGKTVIAHKYKAVKQWSDNVGVVTLFNNKMAIVDSNGALSDTLQYTDIRPFSEGLAVAKSRNGYTLIKKDGTQAIDQYFNFCSDIDKGRAIVKLNSQGYGVINTQGILVVEAKYKSLKKDKFGYIGRVESGKYVYLDNNGNRRIRQEFDKALPFDYDLSIVLNDDMYNLIDKSGKIKTEIIANNIQYGGEKTWKIKKGNKWGILDSQGNEICEPQFDNTYQFKEGILAVGSNQRWGYVDMECNEVLDYILPLAWSFNEGFCRIILNGRYSMMNKNGDIKSNIKFIELRDFHNGLAKASAQ